MLFHFNSEYLTNRRFKKSALVYKWKNFWTAHIVFNQISSVYWNRNFYCRISTVYRY